VIYAYSADEVPGIPTLSHPKKLHVAAAITSEGRSELNIFEENLTAAMYIDILSETILPGGRELLEDEAWTLAQDNDPKHTSATVSAFLDREDVNYFSRDDWPSLSPDLNPMDTLWSMLVDAINKQPPRTIAQLKTRLRKEWEILPQEKIRKP